MQVRRVVTGTTAERKSVFASDTAVDAITLELLPGYEFHRLWGSDAVAALPESGADRPPMPYFPSPGGFRFGLFTVPPDTTVLPENLDLEAALAELDASLPGMAAHMEPENPGMHTTQTIDFEYVVSGRVVLELDDGATVELGPGDTVVQNGTRHAWRNPFTEPCQMVVVLLGATRTESS
ncbi:MAG TPA: cupin domain-containing protein [Acidimicrobiia bacterium]|nr:cupin domain-containing protein [Acidimicrobiia bacterium]